MATAAYTPTTWEDEVPGATPQTYDISTVATDVEITPHDAPTPGTPMNASNLNHLEGGVEDAHERLDVIEADTRQPVYIGVIATDEALEVADGLYVWTVPEDFDGMQVIDADAALGNPSSSGLPTFRLYNLTTSHYILSTNITVDVGEYNSYNAETPSAINPSYKVVSKGDRIRIDCTVAGTGAEGFDLMLGLDQVA
jgi:hypothetical protein